jgi:hypothetical protein
MMKRKTMPQNSKKNDYVFSIADGKTLRICSNFESGNIRLVRQVNALSVRIGQFSMS